MSHLVRASALRRPRTRNDDLVALRLNLNALTFGEADPPGYVFWDVKPEAVAQRLMLTCMASSPDIYRIGTAHGRSRPAG